MPIQQATTAIRNAKMTFIITPAEMMAIRFGTLLAKKLRGSNSGAGRGERGEGERGAAEGAGSWPAATSPCEAASVV